MTDKRWKAFVQYTDGHFDVYDFEEFDELGDLLEAGPDWNEIESVTITYQFGERGGRS